MVLAVDILKKPCKKVELLQWNLYKFLNFLLLDIQIFEWDIFSINFQVEIYNDSTIFNYPYRKYVPVILQIIKLNMGKIP